MSIDTDSRRNNLPVLFVVNYFSIGSCTASFKQPLLSVCVSVCQQFWC